MIDEDPRLAVLRARIAEWGTDFERHGADIDRDPEAIRRYFHLPGVRFLSTMGIPAAYGHRPEPIGGHLFYGTHAAERVVVMEEFARADAGMLVASPGPLLAGVLLERFGDDDQKAWFYQRMLDNPLWTFFALTEPERGSDAAALRTTLVRGESGAPGLLSGTKRYVGNACRAQLGTVFARVAPGPLGIVAALLDTPAKGFAAEPLPTLGLRGARLSAITMTGVEVTEDRLLGRHLSPARRGLWAFVQTFNLLRPGVAAIAVGIARAAYDYVVAHRTGLRRDERDRLDRLRRDIDGARRLTQFAAAAVDARASDGHLASAAKVRAVRLAELATTTACSFFGPGARLDHPRLDKLVRDARGMEFIEGTNHMQKLNVFQGVLSGRIAGGEAPHPHCVSDQSHD